jgi:hypothetical protein
LAKPEFKRKYLKTMKKINPRQAAQKEKHKAFKTHLYLRDNESV